MVENAIRNDDPMKLVAQRIDNLTYLLDVGTMRKRKNAYYDDKTRSDIILIKTIRDIAVRDLYTGYLIGK